MASVLKDLHQQIKVAGTICNDWTHHLLQHTCSDSGAGALLLGRLLRAASVNREKLVALRDYFVLLDAAIRRKRPTDYKFKNIATDNIVNTVNKSSKKLDEIIEEMEYEWRQVEKLVNNEKVQLQEIKKLLGTMDQKMVTIAPQLRSRESRESSPVQARIENKNSRDTVKQQDDSEPKKPDPKATKEETRPLTDEEYLEWLINENSGPCEECGCRNDDWSDGWSEDDDDRMKAKRKRLDDTKELITSAPPKSPTKEVQPKRFEDNKEPTSSSTKEAKKELMQHRLKDLEKELADLRFSYECLPKRRIGLAPNCPEQGVCSFCNNDGSHFSDSCPRITNGDERWHFVRDKGLCQHCLRDHGPECRDGVKECWYCKIAKKTVLKSLIPLDGGHHGALCNIPDAKPKIAERIRDVEQEIKTLRQ